MADQSLQGEPAIENSHHHPPRARVEAAVHHQQVAVVDAGAGHGVAAHPQEKGAGGMADQLFIQIDSHFHVVICGRGKTGGDPLAGQRQGQSLAPWLEGERVGLELHRQGQEVFQWYGSTTAPGGFLVRMVGFCCCAHGRRPLPRGSCSV